MGLSEGGVKKTSEGSFKKLVNSLRRELFRYVQQQFGGEALLRHRQTGSETGSAGGALMQVAEDQ